MTERLEMETMGTKQPTKPTHPFLIENLHTEGKDCVFRNPGLQMSPVCWVNTSASLGYGGRQAFLKLPCPGSVQGK